MTALRYRSFVNIEELAIDECTIHRALNVDKRFWNLWFYVLRETDLQPETFCVPVIPGGSYTENGPGGRSWGLTRAGPASWQISPSINVLQDEDARRMHAGEHSTLPSLWHQTPLITEVPDEDSWTSGGAP